MKQLWQGIVALSIFLGAGIQSAYAQGGTHLLQLGSFEDRATAEARWRDLAEKYEALSALSLNIVEVSLPPDNFKVYRTQAGPVSRRAQAESICSELNKNSDDCYVVETAMFSPARPAQYASQVPSVATPADIPIAAPTPLAGTVDPVSRALDAVAESVIPDISAPMALEVTQPVEVASPTIAKPTIITGDNPPADPFAPVPSPQEVIAPSQGAIAPSADEEEESFFASLFSFNDDDNQNNASSAENVIEEATEIPVPIAVIPETPPTAPIVAPVELANEVPPAVLRQLPPPPALQNDARWVEVAQTTAEPEVPVAINRPADAILQERAKNQALNPEGYRLPPPPLAPRYPDRFTANASKPRALPSPPTLTADAPPLATASLNTPFAVKASPAVRRNVTTPAITEDWANTIEAGDGQVDVAEAVRVPLSTGTMPSAVDTTSRSLGTINALPSQNKAGRTLWAQVSYFPDQSAALSQWENFRRANVDIPPLRVRVTRAYLLPSSGEQRVSLRLGPFDSAKQIDALCASLPTQGQSCRAIADIGSSVVANKPRYSGYEARRNQRYVASNARVPMRIAQPVYYWLQLGSYPTRQQADFVWNDLRNQHRSTLAGLKKHLSHPPLGSNARPIYRLRAGPFMQPGSARNKCASLSSQGVACLVVSGK